MDEIKRFGFTRFLLAVAFGLALVLAGAAAMAKSGGDGGSGGAAGHGGDSGAVGGIGGAYDPAPGCGQNQVWPACGNITRRSFSPGGGTVTTRQ